MGYVLFKSCDAIVTCDENDTVHRGADLLVNGVQVEKIGPHIAIDHLPADTQVIDASSLFIYPGLVNTHHHFF
ncbi:MAG: amidohydrolase family protein, partial [Paracoccaceae bacterium]